MPQATQPSAGSLTPAAPQASLQSLSLEDVALTLPEFPDPAEAAADLAAAEEDAEAASPAEPMRPAAALPPPPETITPGQVCCLSVYSMLQL